MIRTAWRALKNSWRLLRTERYSAYSWRCSGCGCLAARHGAVGIAGAHEDVTGGCFECPCAGMMPPMRFFQDRDPVLIVGDNRFVKLPSRTS